MRIWLVVTSCAQLCVGGVHENHPTDVPIILFVGLRTAVGQKLSRG